MHPSVTGCPELVIRRSVGILEVEVVVNVHGSVIARGWCNTRKLAGLAVEGDVVAFRDVRPFADRIGHKANFVHAVSIVESVRREDATV